MANSPEQNVEYRDREEVGQAILDLIASNQLPIAQVSVAVDAVYDPQRFRVTEGEVTKLLGLGDQRNILVREGLAVLVRDGIMGLRPQVGFWVWDVSPDEAREVLQRRSMLETSIISRAAKWPADASRPRNILTLIEEFAESGDAYNFTRSETTLHHQMAIAVGALTGSEAIRGWSNKLRVYRAVNPYKPEEMLVIAQGHRAVFDALSEVNPAAAITAHSEQTQYLLRGINNL